MANFSNIVTGIEDIIAFILIILIFFALVFYMSTFFEERMNSTIKFARSLALFVLFLSLLIPFSGYSFRLFIVSLVSNALWLSVLGTGFPFIPVLRWDLVSSFIFTLITHVLWMIELSDSVISGFLALYIFVFIVWSVPFVVVISLSAIDEEAAEAHSKAHKKNHNLWTDKLKSLISWTKAFLPHSGNKYQ